LPLDGWMMKRAQPFPAKPLKGLAGAAGIEPLSAEGDQAPTMSADNIQYQSVGFKAPKGTRKRRR